MTQMLYVIRSEAGPAKIGLAVNPFQRARELQTGNPHRIHVRHYFDVTESGYDPRDTERCVHYELRDKRLVGEWFDVSDDEIWLAMERAEPRKFGAEAETGATPSTPAAMRKVTATTAVGALPGIASPLVAGSNPAGPTKFDKTAYQREYMRKRREKQRGGQT